MAGLTENYPHQHGILRMSHSFDITTSIAGCTRRYEL